jgi:plasmid stability protein
MNIQIRHVSEEVHRTLKVRAAQSGMTLSDYLRAELELLADRPTIAELAERIRRRPRVRLPTAAAVRAEREARR